MIELCHYCHKKPIAKSRRAYCSEDCQRAADSERKRNVYKKIDYGEGKCKICANKFKRKRIDQITCGKKECQVELSRIRHRVESEFESEIDDPGIELDRLIERERVRHKTRVERTELLRRIQKQGMMEYVLENIRDIIGSYDPLKSHPIREPLGTKYPEETAISLLSDTHVGEEVLPEDTIGLGEYNYDIFKQGLENLAYSIYEVVDIQRHALTIDELRVYILGDFMTNVLLFPGQANWLDLDLYDQLFLGHQALSEFLVQVASIFKKIKVVAVIGNHGRVEMKKNTQKDYVNYDYFIYRMTQDALKEKCSNIEFELPKSFFTTDTVYNKTFFLSHGDNIERWLNLPWYGIERAALAYHALMSNADIYFDYFVSAHVHQQMNVQAAFGEIMTNGTFVGPNYYSIKKMKSGVAPRQMLFGVNPTRGITWRYWLDLRR